MSDDRLATVQTFFNRTFSGNVDEAVKLLGPNVEYRVPDRSLPTAGTFVGPKAVASHLRKFLEMTGVPIDVLQWEDWLIGSTYIAGVVRSELQRPGHVEEFRFIFLVQVGNDNKITRVEAFYSDPKAIERFWAG